MLVSTHECGWKGFQSLYSLLNFVYDRGKLYEFLFDARNHKLRGITFGDLGALCAFGIDSYTINLLLIPLPL
jgi:hypothetical protein